MQSPNSQRLAAVWSVGLSFVFILSCSDDAGSSVDVADAGSDAGQNSDSGQNASNGTSDTNSNTTGSGGEEDSGSDTNAQDTATTDATPDLEGDVGIEECNPEEAELCACINTEDPAGCTIAAEETCFCEDATPTPCGEEPVGSLAALTIEGLRQAVLGAGWETDEEPIRQHGTGSVLHGFELRRDGGVPGSVSLYDFMPSESERAEQHARTSEGERRAVYRECRRVLIVVLDTEDPEALADAILGL